MKKTLGYIILSTPIILLIVAMIADIGLVGALLTLVLLGLIFGCIVVGTKLIMEN